MDKRATVIESIQKLLALGVADKEIAENLADVGIEHLEAAGMIREARAVLAGEKPSKSGPVIKQPVVSEGAAPNEPPLSMNEEIVRQIPISKKSSVQDAGAVGEETAAILSSPVKGVAVVEDVSKDEANEEKAEALAREEGIEQKPLNEAPLPVRGLRQGKSESRTDSDLKELEKKVSSQGKAQGVDLRAEKAKPFSVPFDSAPLPKSDVDYEGMWKKGIVVAVNAKLSEMKRLKDDVDSKIAQRVEESVRKELYQFKVLIDSQKELIISSNKEALDQKQKEIVFIIDAKIAELRQYNRQLGDNLAALESAKRQQDAALEQINSALDDARRTKSQLVVEMNSELIKSKSGAQAFLDSTSKHLAQMDERINKALELEKNIAEGMLAQAEQRIEQLTIQRADELIAELQVELNKLQTTSKKISPEAIEQKISVLDEFKKQFLTSMQSSLGQINSAISELNRKNLIAQQELDEKTLAIDAKLEELTKFEKDLTERLDRQLKK